MEQFFKTNQKLIITGAIVAVIVLVWVNRAVFISKLKPTK